MERGRAADKLYGRHIYVSFTNTSNTSLKYLNKQCLFKYCIINDLFETHNIIYDI